MSFRTKFSNLGNAERIWTVSAVHGQTGKLRAIHDFIAEKFSAGDKIVYTGNYLGGDGAEPLATLEEILGFRKNLMAARPAIAADDIVYLRGQQEELLGKLLQLQFAPNAAHVIEWMQKHHPEIDAILSAYGTSYVDAARVAREGVISVTRWVTFLKNTIRQHAGHEKFFSVLRRAAFTEHPSNDDNILFVHSGVNPGLPLISQGDSFWWSSRQFSEMETPYAPFRAVIRGFDPEHAGVKIGAATLSLDGGCGFGGKLVCARLSGTGDVLELLSA